MEPIDFQETLLRLAAATMAGAIIGLNREVTHKPAGLRTHALVALGAAVITLVSVQYALGALPREDGAVLRTVQGIVTGIGFIGGGVILRIPQTESVHGLTTAATVWIVAGLGIACGLGAWEATWVALGLALVVLMIGNVIEKVIHKLSGKEERQGGFGPKSGNR